MGFFIDIHVFSLTLNDSGQVSKGFFFRLIVQNKILSILLFCIMDRKGIPSIFIFCGMVRNKILKFSFFFAFMKWFGMEFRAEKLGIPSIFRSTNFPAELIKVSVCSMFHEIIFSRKMATLLNRRAGSKLILTFHIYQYILALYDCIFCHIV